MYLKFLTAEGKSPFRGFPWPLPKDGQPGEWVEVKGDLVKCGNGIHAATPEQAAVWIDARCFEIEFEGEVQQDAEKVWGRRARLVREFTNWNERTQRLLACDCAEHVAHLGDEKVLREVIAVARRYANGEATKQELEVARAAAWDAARAAGDAAWDAARDAAWAAARAAGDAARDAWDAAWAAACAAEREWQSARLMQYINGEVE